MDIDVEMSEGRLPPARLAREEKMLLHHLRLLDEFLRRDLEHLLAPIGERCETIRRDIHARQQLIRSENMDHCSIEYMIYYKEDIDHNDFVAWLLDQKDMKARSGQIHVSQGKALPPSEEDKKRSSTFMNSNSQTTGHPSSKRHRSSVDLTILSQETRSASPLAPAFASDHAPSMVLTPRSRPSEPAHGYQPATTTVSVDTAPSTVSSSASGFEIKGFSTELKFSRLAIIPCLRCKILKRKCDNLQQCSHCPKQSDQNESDYWKVLGCFRGSLHELANVVFRDKFLLSAFKAYGFTLAYPGIALSMISPSAASFHPEQSLDHISKSSFGGLEDSAWEDISSRRVWSKEAGNYDQHWSHPLPSQDLNAFDDDQLRASLVAWRLLQVVSTNALYLGETAYNVFTLLRLTRAILPTDSKCWQVFRQSQILVCATAELHLQVSQYARSTTSMLGERPTLHFANIKAEMESFLRIFEQVCHGRGKLTAQKQIACFYALLLFDVFRSLLIDVISIEPTPSIAVAGSQDKTVLGESMSKDSDVVRINSVYKTAVSVFAWASKNDLMLDFDDSTQEDEDISILSFVQDTRKMLQVDQWLQQGVKSSKDFLLSLGSYLLPGGQYNGFFVQMFGLDSLTTKQSVNNSDQDLAKNNQALFPASRPLIDLQELSTSMSYSSDEIGMRTGKELIWELPDVTKNRLRFIPEGDGLRLYDETPRNAVRTGKLDPEVAEKARRMRKIRACWKCWVQKVPCSPGAVCERCSKLETPRYMCDRTGFKDYSELFFPEFMYNRSKATSAAIISRCVEHFTDGTFAISATFDGKHFMSLDAQPFVPKKSCPREIFRQGADGKVQTFESIAVGMVGIEERTLTKMVVQYLGVVQSTNWSPIVAQDTAALPIQKVLQALYLLNSTTKAQYFATATKNGLLLPLIYSLSGRVLSFTEDCLSEIKSRSNIDIRGSNETVSSLVVEIQICRTLHVIALDIVEKVLEHLEKSMRGRTKDSWPTSFEIILVLCSCVEEMEISLVVAWSIKKVSDEATGDSRFREQLLSACTKVEECLAIIIDVFHSI
ncbi:hypothetical protein BKA64DRAFT_60775 [Cadophora sp. MPI-SDFR-AT-0126]|nr:hypothetical protein BKA64DRAFT_60775 [Leotiomycetes sp. MPI-SDFR-AT-0126]